MDLRWCCLSAAFAQTLSPSEDKGAHATPRVGLQVLVVGLEEGGTSEFGVDGFSCRALGRGPTLLEYWFKWWREVSLAQPKSIDPPYRLPLCVATPHALVHELNASTLDRSRTQTDAEVFALEFAAMLGPRVKLLREVWPCP